MNAPLPSEHLTAGAQSSHSFAGNLPIELIWSILDAAIAQHRDALVWSPSLSLVCRSTREFVLPIVYEVVNLKVRDDHEHEFTGWDGRTHQDLHLAFLSWLLHDPTAPPRRHIKHLIFHSNDVSTANALEWSSGSEIAGTTGDPGERLVVERLTVRFRSDASDLYHAGLRPRKTFHICLMSLLTRASVTPDFGQIVRATTLYKPAWAVLWFSKENAGGAEVSFIRQSCLMRTQFGSMIGSTVVPASGPSHFLRSSWTKGATSTNVLVSLLMFSLGCSLGVPNYR